MPSICIILLKASCPSFSLIFFFLDVLEGLTFIFFSFLPSFLLLCSLLPSLSDTHTHICVSTHTHRYTSLALSSSLLLTYSFLISRFPL